MSTRFASSRLSAYLSHSHDQRGINMVDLMMWLVIAALLLAAALQGIGFYQRAAWTNNLTSDMSNVRVFLEGYKATNAVYPTQAELNSAVASRELLITKGNSIAGYTLSAADNWAIRLCSDDLNKATDNAVGSAIRISRNIPNTFEKAQCNA